MFWQDSNWVKKEGDEDFDLPMRCYDGAEICELVGIFIQNKLCKFMNKKDFGLHRDDGLGALSRYLKNVDSLLHVKQTKR